MRSMFLYINPLAGLYYLIEFANIQTQTPLGVLCDSSLQFQLGKGPRRCSVDETLDCCLWAPIYDPQATNGYHCKSKSKTAALV